jgi:hypothetical protein
VHIHSGKSCNEVLLECCNGLFCGVDTIVVQGGKLNVDVLQPDIFFNCGGSLTVHHVQRRLVTSCFEDITSVNAVTMAASVREGMVQTIIALRS